MGEVEGTATAYWQTAEERLTEQFYQWEKRGRGWQLWSYPVPLEPPFRPFFGHYLPPVPAFDDARKPHWLVRLVQELFLEKPTISFPSAAELDTELEPDLFANLFVDESRLVELSVSLPREQGTNREAAERLLLSLSPSLPLGFEILGLSDSLSIQFVCREPDRATVRDQLGAFFPDAVITEETGCLAGQWCEAGNREVVIVEFGLSREFMLRLRTFPRLDPDPLIPFTGALVDLQKGELGLFQVLFEPVRSPWAESAMRAVADWEGSPFFIDAPDMVRLAKEKVGSPLYAVVLRVAAKSGVLGRGWQIVRGLAGAFSQFGTPSGNELIPLASDEDIDLEVDLLLRQTHRSGMILSSDELVSLVHLPSASVRAAKLRREERKTKAAPLLARGKSLSLGENIHRGVTVSVTVGPEERTRHTYVIGATGTGKSTLLLNLICQDIEQGEGVAVLDPHGDLIDEVLGRIPEARFTDVILLDPGDEDYPVGFNILSAHSETEKNLLASDLVAVFRRLSTTWGDQMNSVLGNAIQAFLESGRGGTLSDLRRFLVERDFRERFLETVRGREVVYYWRKEFPLLMGKPQGPILTRLDTFLRPKPVRYMVSQKENRLDFRRILDEGKIFLAKLAQGSIGEENASLLGSLLVSKFHQVAMSRQEVAPEKRRNFYLYIDEFHNFVTPSMAALLSGVRKYRLGLTLAHEELRQLQVKSPEVLSAVLSNPCTRICFRVGDHDAKQLESGFSSFDASDLKNLSVGEAICRIERAENDFNLRTPPLPRADEAVAAERRERLVALAREKFARRREEVERELFGEPESRAETYVPVTVREERTKPRIFRELEPPPASPPRQPRPRPMEPPPLGRGGSQHKYLQELIKRWAEDRGYRATIEKEILDGLGSVDVALEKDGFSLACEISVASTVEQELGNIQKCLAAGFDHVALLSLEKKNLMRAKELVSGSLEPGLSERVLFFSPEELFSFLEARSREMLGGEETVRGYRVRVSLKSVGEEETKSRMKALSGVIARTLRKLKGE